MKDLIAFPLLVRPGTSPFGTITGEAEVHQLKFE